MNRNYLPLPAQTLVQTIERMEQTQAVSPARDANYQFLALLDEAEAIDTLFYRPERSPDGSWQRVLDYQSWSSGNLTSGYFFSNSRNMP